MSCKCATIKKYQSADKLRLRGDGAVLETSMKPFEGKEKKQNT